MTVAPPSTVPIARSPNSRESSCSSEPARAANAARCHTAEDASLNASKLVVVIPAFEAAQWIEDVATRAAAFAHRVIVVDDGSTDQTSTNAQRVGSPVEVHRFESNQGKGAALRQGFRMALADERVAAVITVDADGQHLPEEIPKLLAKSSEADLVLGSRHHLFGAMFWLRRLSNTLSSRGISLAAGCSLCDVQTGFRLYRRSLLEQVPMTEDRFEAESAIVVRAARRGFRIRSASVELGAVDGRSTSHYRPLVDSLRIALAVLAARSLGGKR